ncbi:nuclear transport factor 2 family protein [Salipiger thiooxidans]|uniref:nuclear transport factor 2 family protein n=1 Tax=Salipiger thiooxidans TaxID=282683 RepID=UPI001CD7E67D|nr:nuclear transport factor 2 family protein [Salipiger thiooxidans]MCA0851552.1 nuclear transport factor 2 family protein [Salipiger thiooxidans]
MAPVPIREVKRRDRSLPPILTQTTVIDEGNTYTGRDAIRQWMANASTLYTYTVEPFEIAEDGQRTIVTSHLVGNFPGSPVDLRYFFVLRGNKIAELEIVS